MLHCRRVKNDISIWTASKGPGPSLAFVPARRPDSWQVALLAVKSASSSSALRCDANGAGWGAGPSPLEQAARAAAMRPPGLRLLPFDQPGAATSAHTFAQWPSVIYPCCADEHVTGFSNDFELAQCHVSLCLLFIRSKYIYILAATCHLPIVVQISVEMPHSP